ncbi:carboxylate--amine ligase [Solibacillus sp. R5-41]|uniref:carboxylate--amine ligase n=1 Tax=Solibacillus sp. R5-41 TaxID=2048654 RepID=UPI000C128F63|nr:ATP-grasp domain-containing protein [Solibacillus sp. R5-41]ATP41606.1 carboxylate--amine ligase [Solibacillus sp. R5-41]
MSKQPFLPIIVGTDINAYNMAISFHEEYNIRPILVGKGVLPFTNLSTIPRAIEYDKKLGDPAQFAKILISVAKKYEGEADKLILIGTNDLYVRLIIENRTILKDYFAFNNIDVELMEHLQIKSNFYKLCEQHGIDIPTTYFYDCRVDDDFTGEMMYPVIIKPSNGIEYSRHPFEGQAKVFKVDSSEEVQKVIDMVKASGYQEELIIQDFIPGEDTAMWDSVIYVSSKGETQLVTFAQVALQEHTKTAIGNYTAVLSRYNEEVMTKLRGFLEAVDYRGFANFDLKYDERDGKFKVFEVNIRQGRSSYYVTAMGHNMARYFVDDLIFNEPKPCTYLKGDLLFSVVPKIVLRKFVADSKVQADIQRLIRERKMVNPLFYKQDKSFKRKFYLFMRQINYYKKYKENSW